MQGNRNQSFLITGEKGSVKILYSESLDGSYLQNNYNGSGSSDESNSSPEAAAVAAASILQRHWPASAFGQDSLGLRACRTCTPAAPSAPALPPRNGPTLAEWVGALLPSWARTSAFAPFGLLSQCTVGCALRATKRLEQQRIAHRLSRSVCACISKAHSCSCDH